MTTMKKFAYTAPKNVFFGEGETGQIVGVLNSLSATFDGGTILVLTDQGVGGTGVPSQIASTVESAGFKTHFVDTVPREPYSEDVDTLATELAAVDVRGIVAVGGGSVLDTAKLLSILIKWGGDVTGLMEKGIRGPGFPCLMIPTTAGTGSEATPNAIVALREKQLKVGIVSPFLMPDYVILDPLMTRSLPPPLTASTGVDAYCHVLECYTSNKANPYSDAIALEGIRLIDGAIRKAYSTGDDMGARAEMLLGSFYGGLAIASSGTTAVHALSYPLGGRYRIPHGVSNAILMVPVFEFNKQAITDKLLNAARVCGITEGSSVEEMVDHYIDHLRQMIQEVNIPTSMTQFGVTPDAIPELTEAAFNVKRLLNNNPREMTKEDIAALYQSIR